MKGFFMYVFLLLICNALIFSMESEVPLVGKQCNSGPQITWSIRKDGYYNQIESLKKDNNDLIVEIKEETRYKKPRVKVMSPFCVPCCQDGRVEGWGPSEALGVGCGAVPTCLAGGFWASFFTSNPPGTLGLAVALTTCAGGLCCGPTICKTIDRQRRALRVHWQAVRYIRSKFALDNSLLKAIEKQNIEGARRALERCSAEDLREYYDVHGDGLISYAIDCANKEKDPNSVIIKLLIAEGCPLWYSKKPKIENGNITNKFGEPLPFEQPLLKIVNRRDLHQTVLKPLTQIAAQKLSQIK